MDRIKVLVNYYGLVPHSEGGLFNEVYKAPFSVDGEKRSTAASIYFLLDGKEVSHFHQIDCDEIWYYHEGCGMKLTMVDKDGNIEYKLLGTDVKKHEEMMLLIPKGIIFAAENIDKESYTFISCATTPCFTYEGFRLVYKSEIEKLCGDKAKDVIHFAY